MSTDSTDSSTQLSSQSSSTSSSADVQPSSITSSNGAVQPQSSSTTASNAVKPSSEPVSVKDTLLVELQDVRSKILALSSDDQSDQLDKLEKRETIITKKLSLLGVQAWFTSTGVSLKSTSPSSDGNMDGSVGSTTASSAVSAVVQPTTATSGSNFRIPSGCSIYNPLDSDGLNVFLNQIENACVTNKIADADRHLVLLHYLVLDSEEHVWVTKNANKYTTFAALKLAFATQFRNVLLETKAQEAILSFAFVDDEHPDSARIRFQRLLVQANESLSNSKLITRCFIRAIPLELEKILRTFFDLDRPQVPFDDLIVALKRAHNTFKSLSVREKANDEDSKLVLAAKVTSGSSSSFKKSKKKNKKSKPFKSSSSTTSSGSSSASNPDICINYFIKKNCNRSGCAFSHNPADFAKLSAAFTPEH